VDFSQVRKEFLHWQQALRSGQVTAEQFRAEVEKLQVQQSDGSCWRIKEDGTGWLSWTGAGWVPGVPPMTRMPAGGFPRTLGQYFTRLARETAKNIPEKMVFFIVLFIAAWGLNVYLMLGYRIPWWGPVSQFLSTILGSGSSWLTRLLLWFLLSALGASLAADLRKDGAKKFLCDLARIPVAFSNVFRKNPFAWPFLLGSAAVSLLIATAVGSILFSLLLILAFARALSKGPRSSLFLLSTLAWHDVRRLLKVSPAAGREDSTISQFLTGFTLGALLSFFLYTLPAAGYLGSLVLAAAAVVFVFNHNKSAVQG
jgi:hypothetical protein